MLPDLIEKADLPEGIGVLADKGYCSKKNSHCLASHGLIDGIMHKASRGKKLTDTERSLNKVISKTRSLIERTFGSIRLWFSGGRYRYRGLERTHTQNILEVMAYNLKRKPRLFYTPKCQIVLMPLFRGGIPPLKRRDREGRSSTQLGLNTLNIELERCGR